jgi:dihydrofolate synthase/folylpolyglutamate synthase
VAGHYNAYVTPNLGSYLASLTDLALRMQNTMHAQDFSLGRMQILVAALQNPQQKYPSLHVAGTNGKGSVIAFTSAALQAQGYKTGTFTSPHLQGALRGIAINANPVSETELQATFQNLWLHLQNRDDWTHFEVVTALAFLHFAEQQVDIAVIEVGLGGLLDATNVILPTVSVITPIDFDHTSILGKSLAEIAAHKAGIVKSGVPVVMALQNAEAAKVIRNVAAEKQSALTEVGVDWLYKGGKLGPRGQDFHIRKDGESIALELQIALLGKHQLDNAATAFAALQAIKEQGIQISDVAIEQGFAAARWPGRFEVLQSDPAVVLDAAHSPAAALALRQALDEYFPRKRIVALLGVSGDKDLEGLLAPLSDRLDQITATQSGHARAMPAEELKEHLLNLGLPAQAEEDLKVALKNAILEADSTAVVLVFGSVFLVELAREIFQQTLTA